MWTVKITPQLIVALLAAKPAGALDQAIVQLALMKALDHEDAGHFEISTKIAKRLSGVVSLDWRGKDNG